MSNKQEAKPKADIQTTSPPNQGVPVYAPEEFIQNAEGVFGLHRDIVSSALDAANAGRLTVEEAKKIITQFAERKV